MKRLLIVLLALTATACGVRPTDVIEGDPAPTEEEITEGTVLYFLQGATLTRVVRPPSDKPLLELLAQGPTPEEQAEGFTTEIPQNASPITLVPATNGTTVRVASRLKDLSPLAQSQLVCTAITPDQPPGVEIILEDATETLPPQRCPFEA